MADLIANQLVACHIASWLPAASFQAFTSTCRDARRLRANTVAATLWVERHPSEGDAALLEAVRRGDLCTTQVLLHAGAFHRGALPKAARSGDAALVASLLAHARPADVEYVDADGDTALMAATRNRRFATALTLIRAGADVNFVGRGSLRGDTVLAAAVRARNYGILPELVKAGARIDAINPGDHNSVLSCAAVTADEQAAPLLVLRVLGLGATVDLELPDGETAMTLAARRGKLAAVATLIRKGADVDHVNPYTGQTALWQAIHCNHPDVVACLVRHRARVDYFNPIACATLRYMAHVMNRPECERYLQSLSGT